MKLNKRNQKIVFQLIFKVAIKHRNEIISIKYFLENTKNYFHIKFFIETNKVTIDHGLST